MADSLPPRVARAQARAAAHGFTMSCEPTVGRLLATLAAAVPGGGRILELGTGVGAGLAWLLHGLGPRTDVEVVTVELDPATLALAREEQWPDCVRFECGDGAAVVRDRGRFDLIFPDAPGGKLTGLRHTLGALRERGVVIVDDMDLAYHDDPDLRAALTQVREQLLTHPELIATELRTSSGIIVATRAA